MATSKLEALREEESRLLAEFRTIKKEYNSYNRDDPEDAPKRAVLKDRYRELDGRLGEILAEHTREEEVVAAGAVGEEPAPLPEPGESTSALSGMELGDLPAAVDDEAQDSPEAVDAPKADFDAPDPYADLSELPELDTPSEDASAFQPEQIVPDDLAPADVGEDISDEDAASDAFETPTSEDAEGIPPVLDPSVPLEQVGDLIRQLEDDETADEEEDVFPDPDTPLEFEDPDRSAADASAAPGIDDIPVPDIMTPFGDEPDIAAAPALEEETPLDIRTPDFDPPPPAEPEVPSGDSLAAPQAAESSDAPDFTEPVAEVPDSGMRPCPYCAEPIRAEAKKCRHCNEFLARVPRPVGKSHVSRPPKRKSSGRKRGMLRLAGFATVFLGIAFAATSSVEMGRAQLQPLFDSLGAPQLAMNPNGLIFGIALALLGGSFMLAAGLLQRVRVNGGPSIQEFARAGDIGGLQQLIDAGADVNAPDNRGNTPLHIAIEADQPEVVSFLVSEGADIEHATPKGESPLFLVVKLDRRDLLEYMLDHGANVHTTNDRGSSLLHAAAFAGDPELIGIVAAHPLDPNGAGKTGYTPLHYAAQSGHEDAVDCLLELGAKVDIVSSQGHTPLYAAAKNGHLGVVKRLVQAGACEAVEDGSQESPIAIAQENRHEVIAQYLKERAKPS